MAVNYDNDMTPGRRSPRRGMMPSLGSNPIQRLPMPLAPSNDVLRRLPMRGGQGPVFQRPMLPSAGGMAQLPSMDRGVLSPRPVGPVRGLMSPVAGVAGALGDRLGQMGAAMPDQVNPIGMMRRVPRRLGGGSLPDLDREALMQALSRVAGGVL